MASGAVGDGLARGELGEAESLRLLLLLGDLGGGSERGGDGGAASGMRRPCLPRAGWGGACSRNGVGWRLQPQPDGADRRRGLETGGMGEMKAQEPVVENLPRFR